MHAMQGRQESRIRSSASNARKAQGAVRRTLWSTLYLIATTGLVALFAFEGPANAGGGRAQFCSRVLASIRALPASTQIEDWPSSIHIPGLAHPRWAAEDPLTHLEVLKTVAAYMDRKNGDIAALPGAPGAPNLDTAWEGVKGEWLTLIRNGTMKLESTTVSMPSLLHGEVTVRLFRLGIPNKSLGTFEDPLTKYSGAEFNRHHEQEPLRPHWKLVVGSVVSMPDVHNIPLDVEMDNQDVMIVHHSAYVVAPEPIAYIVRYSIASQERTIMQPRDGVCEFNLLAGPDR